MVKLGQEKLITMWNRLVYGTYINFEILAIKVINVAGKTGTSESEMTSQKMDKESLRI